MIGKHSFAVYAPPRLRRPRSATGPRQPPRCPPRRLRPAHLPGPGRGVDGRAPWTPFERDMRLVRLDRDGTDPRTFPVPATEDRSAPAAVILPVPVSVPVPVLVTAGPPSRVPVTAALTSRVPIRARPPTAATRATPTARATDRTGRASASSLSRAPAMRIGSVSNRPPFSTSPALTISRDSTTGSRTCIKRSPPAGAEQYRLPGSHQVPQNNATYQSTQEVPAGTAQRAVRYRRLPAISAPSRTTTAERRVP